MNKRRKNFELFELMLTKLEELTKFEKFILSF